MTHGLSRWSELHQRGLLWVVAQFGLMAGIVLAWLLPPDWPDSARLPLKVVGLVVIVIGAAAVVSSRRSLGRAFTPLTTPPDDAQRVETGLYRRARHPMYGGAILLFVGVSFLVGPASLAFTAALAVLWRAKSAVEERALVARFPEYEAYRRRTARRFFPGIY
jgi:protein-S-isoprenylcysteine O-methyltransferase Ste14